MRLFEKVLVVGRTAWSRSEVNEVLFIPVLEDLEVGWVVFEAVANGAAPTVFHAFDNPENVGRVVACVGVSDGTGFGDEVTSNDSVQSGAMWVA